MQMNKNYLEDLKVFEGLNSINFVCISQQVLFIYWYYGIIRNYDVLNPGCIK
jgi:hypothetical protein